jgi:hypothetical protein
MKLHAGPRYICRIARGGCHDDIMPAILGGAGHGKHGMQISERSDGCKCQSHMHHPWFAKVKTARFDARIGGISLIETQSQ